MKTLRYVFVGLLAFYVGLLAFEFWYVHTTLAEITANIKHYDGRLVEIETYLQVDSFEGGWTAGEQWEKPEAFTILQLTNEPAQLRDKLSHHLSLSEYNRVKVLLRGRVKDQCTGGNTCCFGQVIKIEDASFVQIGPIEPYTRPIR